MLLVAACTQPPDVAYDGASFRAEGWRGPEPAGGWDEVLAVYAGSDPAAPAMLGDYRRRGGTIVFMPRYPPAPGLKLRAVYRPPGEAPMERLFTQDAGVAAAAASLTGVYPSADVLPANLLKLYVEFSAPMRQGQAWTHVHLLDEAGLPVEDAFVELDQELWDPQGRRLTILFEPGRIKRGVGPNQTQGPPLIEGRRYVLAIEPGWSDANGRPLVTGLRRPFLAGPPVREAIDPQAWKLSPPSAGSSAPLVVTFPRPLDYGLAQSAIFVSRGGAPVPGSVSLADHETRWLFTPSRPWQAGEYRLRIQSRLEDLAGNRPGRVFDIDMSRPARTADAAQPDRELVFRIAG